MRRWPHLRFDAIVSTSKKTRRNAYVDSQHSDGIDLAARKVFRPVDTLLPIRFAFIVENVKTLTTMPNFNFKQKTFKSKMQLRVSGIMLRSGEKFETPECLIPKSNDFKWSVLCFPAIPAKQTEGNIFQIKIHVSKCPVIVMATVVIKNTSLGGTFMHNLNTLDTTPFMTVVTHKDLMASLAFKKNNFMITVEASFVFPVVESKAVSSPRTAIRDALLSCIQVRRADRPIADPVQNLTVADVEEPNGQAGAPAGF